MKAILAIDPGGTKSEAMLTDLEGHILGWGRSESPGVGGRHDRSITEAVFRALPQCEFEYLFLGAVLGLNTMRFLTGMQVDRLEFTGCMEEEGALALAGEPHGVVALSGTGAFVYVRRPNGKGRRFDGHGPYLGDEGSGHYLGLEAVRATLRTERHARHATSLRRRVLEALDLERPYDLVAMTLYNRDRSMVAQLARVVDEEARAGDRIARQIVRRAATALARTVRDAVETCEVADLPLPLVGLGSVICKSDLYWELLQRRLALLTPRLTPTRLLDPPVLGLSLIALKRCREVTDPNAGATLMADARAWLARNHRGTP